ncbi:MAG: DUF922 domain-containing protein [Pseudodesulfovibrio sp.]
MRLLPLLALLLLLPAPAPAEVTVSTSEDHYIVEGSTMAQILAYYRQREDKYTAYARPHFKYSYTWLQQGGACTVTEVKVHLHILYIYPRLANPTGKFTAHWWDVTLKQLARHEHIHGDISRDAANELEREILTVRGVPCSTIKSVVAARASRVLQDHRRRQQEYDRITEHGLKQERYRGR